MMRTEFQDQITHVFASLRAVGHVYVVVDYPRRLELERLQRAARLLLDAEPVLGCRWIDDPRSPVWERRDDLDRHPWARLDEGDDLDRLTRPLLRPAADPAHDDNLAVTLLRAPAGDRLVVAVNHVVADGGACLECVYRLMELYNGLAKDAAFRLPANPASRDSFLWASSLRAADVLRIVGRDLRDAWRGRAPCHGLQREYGDYRTAGLDTPDFAIHRIPAERARAMNDYAAARGCTRNDLLLAGLARAYARAYPGGPGACFRASLPNSLRRFAEVETRPAVCNLGGVAQLTIGPDLGAGFDDTLALVAAETALGRRLLSGAGNPLAMRAMARLPYARKRALGEKLMRTGMHKAVPPVFTNVGRLAPRKVAADGAQPVAAMLVGVATPSPMTVIAALEYAGALTLSVGFQGGERTARQMAELLAAIDAEITL